MPKVLIQVKVEPETKDTLEVVANTYKITLPVLLRWILEAAIEKQFSFLPGVERLQEKDNLIEMVLTELAEIRRMLQAGVSVSNEVSVSADEPGTQVAQDMLDGLGL